jgi:hypothetical protein
MMLTKSVARTPVAAAPKRAMPLLAPSVVPSRQGVVVRYKGDETETIDQLVKADHDKVGNSDFSSLRHSS